MDLFCRDARRARSRFSLTEFFLKCLLAFYIAIAPAYTFAFSPNDLGFDSLRNWGSLPGGGKGDYHFKTAAGEPYSKVGHGVTSSELGGVWRNRWVRGGLWGMAGVAAVSAMLSAVDWILDPANNRIYKKDLSGKNIYCAGRPSTYVNQSGCFTTASEALKFAANNKYSQCDTYCYTWQHYQYIPSDFETKALNLQIGSSLDYFDVIKLTRTMKTGTYSDVVETTFQMKVFKTPEPSEREATEEDIADAVERAEMNYPGTKEALAKPDGEPEGSHGPTEKAKGGAQPDNPPNPDNCKSKGLAFDPAKNQCVKLGTNPNPTTDLPDFCTWAKTLCDWLDWVKKEPELPETPPIKPKDIKSSDIPQGRTINFGGGCPADRSFTISLGITSRTIPIPYKYACDFMIKINPFVNAGGYLVAAWIVVSNVRS